MIEGENSPAGYFRQGEVLGASKLNILADFASRSQTTVNQAFNVIQGPFGTVYDGSSQQEPLAYYDYPFKVSFETTSTPGTFNIYVRAGTVNNWVTKIYGGVDNGKYLDATPKPKLVVSGATMTNTKYVVLRATVGDSKFYPKDSEVYVTDSLESLENSDDKGHALIASLPYTKSGGIITGFTAINQYIYAAQSLIRVKPSTSPCVWNWASR